MVGLGQDKVKNWDGQRNYSVLGRCYWVEGNMPTDVFWGSWLCDTDERTPEARVELLPTLCPTRSLQVTSEMPGIVRHGVTKYRGVGGCR